MSWHVSVKNRCAILKTVLLEILLYTNQLSTFVRCDPTIGALALRQSSICELCGYSSDIMDIGWVVDAFGKPNPLDSHAVAAASLCVCVQRKILRQSTCVCHWSQPMWMRERFRQIRAPAIRIYRLEGLFRNYFSVLQFIILYVSRWYTIWINFWSFVWKYSEYIYTLLNTSVWINHLVGVLQYVWHSTD